MAYEVNGGVVLRSGWKEREATVTLEEESVKLVWNQWRVLGLEESGSTWLIGLDMGEVG